LIKHERKNMNGGCYPGIRTWNIRRNKKTTA